MICDMAFVRRLVVGVVLLAAGVRAAEVPPMRPPAVPLVTHDPYFSVWAMSDRLTDDWSKHWTGRVNAMCGLVRVDGKAYRFAGVHDADVPAMEQKALHVTPTRTIYELEGGGVALTVMFLSPLLPHDLDLMSRPVTYVWFAAKSADGKAHAVQLYYDITGEWAVNTPDQKVTWERGKAGELTTLRPQRALRFMC